MQPLVIGAVLAATFASCGQPPGALFTTTISNPNGELPLAVSLADATGLVLAIGPAEFDQADFRDAGVLPDPGSPTAFVLTWLGGMCDSDVALRFSSTDSGYDLHLAIHERLGGGCPAAGVLRGLRIETTSSIPVGAITISGSKTIQLILDEDCGPLTAAATNDSKIACLALINATIGERTDEFASVTVAPLDGMCPATECSTAAGISSQPWSVTALDRKGHLRIWRCAYRDETASCAAGTEAPSP